jgi:hypothetical protein
MIFEQPLIYLKNNLGNKNQIKYVVKSWTPNKVYLILLFSLGVEIHFLRDSLGEDKSLWGNQPKGYISMAIEGHKGTSRQWHVWNLSKDMNYSVCLMKMKTHFVCLADHT